MNPRLLTVVSGLSSIALAAAFLPKAERPQELSPSEAASSALALDGKQSIIKGKVTVGTEFVTLDNRFGDQRKYIPWTISDSSGQITVYQSTHTDRPLPGSLENQFRAGQSPEYWYGAIASPRGGKWYIEMYPEGPAFKADIAKK